VTALLHHSKGHDPSPPQAVCWMDRCRDHGHIRRFWRCTQRRFPSPFRLHLRRQWGERGDRHDGACWSPRRCL